MTLSMNGTIERRMPNGDWVALALPSAFFDELDASKIAGWLTGNYNHHDIPSIYPDATQDVIGDVYTTHLIPLGQLARFNYTQPVEDRFDYTGKRTEPLPVGRGRKTTYEALFGEAWMRRVAYFRQCNPNYRLRCWFYTPAKE